MPFFARIITHLCLAAWLGAVVLLLLEWVVPGVVSTHVPLFPIAGGVIGATFILAPWLHCAPRWQRILAFVLLALGACGGLGAFGLNVGSTHAWLAVGLMTGVIGLGVLAYFLETSNSTDV